MVRRCPICGELFQSRRKDHVFCSRKCARRNTTVMIKASKEFDYATSNLYDTEWHERPDESDVIVTLNLLRDFGIMDFEDMPEFHSQTELNRWKNQKISEALNS